ncbi:hypothetical protein EB796_012601 [Bugula neritina]|uniref:Uncharacterized protein n=1 Tax=Bugula neritina TaxID=10212 RepID=A0A7J7JSZ8_BUGNE|nr:hypothetical protein EB796_012601 [Bugula neritina]
MDFLDNDDTTETVHVEGSDIKPLKSSDGKAPTSNGKEARDQLRFPTLSDIQDEPDTNKSEDFGDLTLLAAKKLAENFSISVNLSPQNENLSDSVPEGNTPLTSQKQPQDAANCKVESGECSQTLCDSLPEAQASLVAKAEINNTKEDIKGLSTPLLTCICTKDCETADDLSCTNCTQLNEDDSVERLDIHIDYSNHLLALDDQKVKSAQSKVSSNFTPQSIEGNSISGDVESTLAAAAFVPVVSEHMWNFGERIASEQETLQMKADSEKEVTVTSPDNKVGTTSNHHLKVDTEINVAENEKEQSWPVGVKASAEDYDEADELLKFNEMVELDAEGEEVSDAVASFIAEAIRDLSTEDEEISFETSEDEYSDATNHLIVEISDLVECFRSDQNAVCVKSSRDKISDKPTNESICKDDTNQIEYRNELRKESSFTDAEQLEASDFYQPSDTCDNTVGQYFDAPETITESCRSSSRHSERQVAKDKTDESQTEANENLVAGDFQDSQSLIVDAEFGRAVATESNQINITKEKGSGYEDDNFGNTRNNINSMFHDSDEEFTECEDEKEVYYELVENK